MSSTTRIVNSISTAGIAVALTQVLHEAIHLISALVMGVPVRAFNLFAVDTTITYDQALRIPEMIVESSASLVNILIGFVALGIYHLRSSIKPMTRQFLIQLAGFELLMGFGYLLFDGLFYAPGGLGDWKSILYMLGAPWGLRIILIVFGSLGVVWTYFWLSRAVMVFVEDISIKELRHQAAFPILIVPYSLYSAIYLTASLWHPVGFPEGMLIVFFQFVFGFSGFFWAYLFAVIWLTPKRIAPFSHQPPERIDTRWLVLTLIIIALQFIVLLPTIPID